MSWHKFDKYRKETWPKNKVKVLLLSNETMRRSNEKLICVGYRLDGDRMNSSALRTDFVCCEHGDGGTLSTYHRWDNETVTHWCDIPKLPEDL